MKNINKDFYDNLPGIICSELTDMITKYGGEEWFDKAWEEYREHIKTSNMNTMRTPAFVFKKYIN